MIKTFPEITTVAHRAIRFFIGARSTLGVFLARKDTTTNL
jgi:hypothetical protein